MKTNNTEPVTRNPKPTIPGQGHRKTQYQFAATMVAVGFAAFFFFLVALLIARYIH